MGSLIPTLMFKSIYIIHLCSNPGFLPAEG